MKQHGQLAYDNFFKGYNCSQCLAAAFAPEMGLSEERALCLAAGFGGGVGRLREVCGAFNGLVLVLGALYGKADPKAKTELYAAVQQLAGEFRARNGKGALRCQELLGLTRPEGSPVASERTADYYKKRPCPELIRLCAELLDEYIAAHPLPPQNTEETT